MLVKQFPDIQWLKSKIKENFGDKRALNNVVLEHSGWPTVILNTKTDFAERKEIKGPFSIFLNRSGTSQIGLEGKAYQLNEQCYTLSNFGQHYDLLINDQHTETLNIHFGEHFYFETLKGLKLSNEEQLDSHDVVVDEAENLIPRTLYRDEHFNRLANSVLRAYESGEDQVGKEEHLTHLLEYVILNNSKEIKRLQSSLDTKKMATRDELIKRLCLARDYIHAHFSNDISLDELGRASCLSKFHLLRVFKQVFGQTPYQYVKKLRFEKAMEMIRKTQLPLDRIASTIGIENASSLSRLVYQQTTHYPSYFRS